ncbi:MAG: hypothetical protein ACRDVE_12505 [Actinocrinis sp.]
MSHTRRRCPTGAPGIDTVPGATYTGQGYVQSPQSAIDKAGG